MAPLEGTEHLARLQSNLSSIEPGLGWTPNYQAAMQLTSLGITLILAVVSGVFTGLFINTEFLFSSLKDHELFEDYLFWDAAGEDPDTLDQGNIPNTPGQELLGKEAHISGLG